MLTVNQAELYRQDFTSFWLNPVSQGLLISITAEETETPAPPLASGRAAFQRRLAGPNTHTLGLRKR